MRDGDRIFYRRWILANGWAESAGLGTTFVIGRALAPLIESATGAVTVLTTAVIAVVLGTLLEGVVVGAAQERVLRERMGLRPWSWTLATAAGAGFAWLLGMVPSTLLALGDSTSSASTPAEPGVVLRLILAAGLGVVAGPVLGAAQWLVLRRLATRASRWLWANALAWAVGMPLIFAGMDVLPWDGNTAVFLLGLYALCFVTGTVVGAVHGRVLVQLIGVRLALAEPAD